SFTEIYSFLELYLIIILNAKENNDKIVWHTIIEIALMQSRKLSEKYFLSDVYHNCLKIEIQRR
ncbi:MAG: hypothetical protein K2N44_18115, partial [Lachnospiraceae bacterium]|nr:hypothetical protein [Lachnospiraceae bacterium]